MENYVEKRLVTNQISTLPDSTVCPPASSYRHSHELPERFRDNPFFSERLTFNDSSQINIRSTTPFEYYVHPPVPCSLELSISDHVDVFSSEYSNVDNQSNETLSHTIDLAANEILSVGRERGERRTARQMSTNLRQMKTKNERLILEYCVTLYTQASFLYRACHRDLGDYYALSNKELLSYRKLLQLYIDLYGVSYMGTIYRGVMLTVMQLQLILTYDIGARWSSPTYLSTSKSRQVAEFFGNTLLIINIQGSAGNEGKTVDISKLSAIPDEQEVLLTPKYMLFKEKESEFDRTLEKHIIYLTSIRSFPPSTIEKNKYNPPKSKRQQNSYDLHHSFSSMALNDHHEGIKNTDSNSENEFNLSSLPNFNED